MTDFKERQKTNGRLNGVHIYTEGSATIGVKILEHLGEPDYVRLLYTDDKIAFLPCEEDHTNGYVVTDDGGVSLRGLIKHDMDRDVPEGKYTVTYDELDGETVAVIDLDAHE